MGYSKKPNNYYIQKMSEVHNNYYNYSNVKFTKLKEKVIIICPKHGEFLQSVDNHLNGSGCKKCIKRKIDKNWLEKFIKVHNNIYDYSKVNYVNQSTKVEIICKKHGSFYQTPNNHIYKSHNCPECGLESKSYKLLKEFNDYKEELQFFHNNKYDYSKFEYNGFKIPSSIICPKHGEFKQSLSVHRKSGCPTCNESKGEKIISEILDKLNIRYIREKKFEDCILKRKLKFDFWLPDNNICIEYDGIQHFEQTNFGDLKLTKLRDSIKDEYCKNNNIKMIRFRYDQNKTFIFNFIIKYLNFSN